MIDKLNEAQTSCKQISYIAYMEAIVFKPKSKKDQELLMALGKKMNIPYEVKSVKDKSTKKKEVLLEEEEEDKALLLHMKESRKSGLADKSEVLQKLGLK